jgi:hypothetical protein
MGSSVRQRGFEFGECKQQPNSMGKEMCLGIDNAQAPNSIANETASNRCQHLVAANQYSVEFAESEGEESCSVEVGTQVRDDSKESSRQSREKATAAELMSILQLQQFRCALTGEMLTPEVARCDHVIPVSEGGSNRNDNLQWVTDDVNRAKGVMSQDRFISMCIKVANWAQR